MNYSAQEQQAIESTDSRTLTPESLRSMISRDALRPDPELLRVKWLSAIGSMTVTAVILASVVIGMTDDVQPLVVAHATAPAASVMVATR